MRVALLGPLRAAEEDGTPIEIGGARLRMLLARLALDAPRAVPAEALIDGLWGAEPPADAANALQSLVSRLRKVLPAGIESGPAGYRLDARAADVDVNRFEELAANGRRELAAGRDAYAAELLTEALELWRGAALADVLDAPFAQAPAARLAELRAEAAEDCFDAQIRLGRHAEALADLTVAATAEPLRERLAGLRIRALCAAGRQSDALAVYSQLRRTLADQLGVDPSAELQEIHLAALRGELAPPQPVADRLPTRLTSFVGRDEELKLLAELLGGARLVTLVGPGGAGKTRLATEAASRQPTHRTGRVWFAPLAGVRDAGDVLGAVLGALEVRDIRSTDTEVMRRPMDPLEYAVEALSSGESTLVLDNCEHVVDAAARLADELLHRVPSLRILATSREPLAITGEALCLLGPLPVPAERATADQAAELDSIRLFLDRAVAVRPDFALDESTVDAVGQICRRLDGMPLALELAAARLRSMTVSQIAARLDDRFRLLTSGSRTALPRQRTLRAVVEWSWDLLTEAELVLARRLAVFATGAELETIERICADDVLPADDITYVLGALVEKSIVDTVVGARGEPRYRMLETLRVYAAERLAESGERDTFRRAMVACYADLVDTMEPRLRTAAQLDAISWYEAENDNLIAALRTAIELSEADFAAELLLGTFWYLTILGQGERAVGLVQEVLEFGDRLPRDVAAALSAVRGLMYLMPGEMPLDDVPSLVDECVDSGAAEQFPALAIALPMLAFLSGDKEMARREMRRSQNSPDPWARAAGGWAESFMLSDAGDVVGADAARTRAFESFKETGDRWGIAMTLSFKAVSLSQDGDAAGAIELYQEGLRLALELRSQDDAVQQWWRLAIEYARAGEVERAWYELDLAERYARETGNQQVLIMLLFGRAELLLMTGEPGRARELIGQIESLVVESPFPAAMAQEWLSAFEARILLAEGRPDEAFSRVLISIGATVRRGDMPDVASAVEILALIRHAQGRPSDAAWALGVAVLIRGRFDYGNPQIRGLIAELSELLSHAGYEEALRHGRDLSKKDALTELERLAESP